MTARFERMKSREPSEVAPSYEVRVRRHGPGDTEVEVWQLPSLASPHVTAPTRVAGLRGRNLDLVEHRVLRRLTQEGVRLTGRENERREGHPISEDLALNFGLLFRVLAPMRSRDATRAIADGVEAMGREEAAYWL